MWTHAASYRGLGPDKLIHRWRLARILKILKLLRLRASGKWADFGCSDGFILELVRNRVVGERWQLFGFDHSSAKLEEARKRHIPNTDFRLFDLNKPVTAVWNEFDVVTCFETIEHTGHYRNAFDNLVAVAKEGALISVSVPREVGIPGILKFVGRAVIRRNPYRRFFNDASRLHYIAALLSGGNLEGFRNPAVESWGQHLGFDYRNFEAYITDKWVATGRCNLVRRELPFPRFNIMYVFRKAGQNLVKEQGISAAQSVSTALLSGAPRT